MSKSEAVKRSVAKMIEALEVGQSVLISGRSAKGCQVTTCRLARKLGRKFCTRTICNRPVAVQIWRLV